MSAREDIQEEEELKQKELKFQNAVMQALRAYGISSIASGSASSIDEYIIDINDPFRIVALIDFKVQSRVQSQPVAITDDQRTFLSSAWRERVFFVVRLLHEEAKYVILTNKGIVPFLTTNEDRKKGSITLFKLSPRNLYNDEMNSLKESGDIKVCKNMPELIDCLSKLLKSL
ncbi:MAG: hypothetical protein ACFFCS_19565 [Candidatus Hodarchaeota archaeon]